MIKVLKSWKIIAGHHLGVSYMIENREIMMRMFPELFEKLKIETVENYPTYLLEVLKTLTPIKCRK